MRTSRFAVPGLLVAAALAWPLGTWAQEAVEGHGSRRAPMPHSATEGHAAKHAEGGEHGGEHALEEINFADFDTDKPGHKLPPPFVATLINFAILAGAYYYFGKKPLADALKARKVEITKEIEDAQRIKHEAEARAKVFEEKLARLETELAETRTALVAAGQGERDQIVADANAKAERLARETEFLISQEVKQQTQLIWREAVDAAVTAAEELLRVRVTSSDQERLAEEFLRELAHQTPATAGQKTAEVTS